MVSASPEPPSVMPAEWPAEPTAGASSEHKRPTELASDPSHIGRQFQLPSIMFVCDQRLTDWMKASSPKATSFQPSGR